MSKRYYLKPYILYLVRGYRNFPFQTRYSKMTGLGFCFLFFIGSIIFFSFSALSNVTFTKDKCYNVFSQKRIKQGTWMSYQEAKEFIKTQNIKTVTKFYKWRKSKYRPFNFPPSPEHVYKEEWKGWPEFLGKSWMSYEEAKEFIQAQAVRTSTEFRKWRQLGLSPNFPSRPDFVYKEEWKGWPEFLGKSWMSYEEAKKFIQAQAVRTSTEFRKWRKSKYRPINFPSRPEHVYKEEWKGWPEFLGKSWMSYEEAKEFIQAQAVRTFTEFRKWRKSKYRPFNFPPSPEQVYKKKWKGWPEFLGKSWMSYEEAKQIIQKEGITSTFMFQEWKRSGHRPFNFPSKPDLVYKEEWISWGSFFGTGRKRRTIYK